MSDILRACLVGTGGMSHHHIRDMLSQRHDTEIVAVCEPSPKAYDAAATVFRQQGVEPPPNVPDLGKLLTQYDGRLNAAFIITPHALHRDQTIACMEAGLDVLLEKPMVVNAAEALDLIAVRDRTKRLLVVAFQGGLSPQIRAAAQMLRSGELGQILNVSGVLWQNWAELSDGTWRQDPTVSGGGFLFDTGAHMLNTIADLVGEEFAEVAAWFDNRGRKVDVLAAVMARTTSGMLVTINACGDTIESCESDIRVFCTKAIIRTGQWGERLEIQRAGRRTLRPVKLPPMRGAWEQFAAVRRGEIANPCPPEIGLRMARLWDAARASAANNGQPVKVE